MRRWAVGLLLGVAAPAIAHEDVRYGNAPDWVLPPPAVATPEQSQGAFALIYRDIQVSRDDDGLHYYEASRTRIQSSEALALGSVALVWNPAAGGPTVHHLKVIRDGEVIDVLEKERFAIFQREGALEQSMINGLLTANLQVPGLRVGDEIEFAATTTSLDPTVPDHAFGLMAVPQLPSPGTYRMRVRWEDGKTLAWSATPDIADAVQVKGNEALVVLDKPALFEAPNGAPARFAFSRLIDFSDFSDWPEVSRRFQPLYVEAAQLAAGSELREEAARIARRYSTPRERAAAALKLVQDQIRYVYVGLNGGNFRPATADETWDRRWGDCKGKTAMLMALLSELGIEAEPVLVNLTSSDGFDQRLPSPVLFDHVLVRTTIDGVQYWLDGTRQGDARLLTSPPEPFRWVLPLTATGTGLEAIPFAPLADPAELNLNLIDATAGIDEPVRHELTRIYRGSTALQLRTALQALPAGSDKAALRNMFESESKWIELEDVNWRYVEDRGALVLSAVGTYDPEWDEADEYSITEITVPGAGFYSPAERKRPAAQDRSAPYANDPSRFTCHVTTIKLPQAGPGRGWEHTANAMNQRIGGVAYWRAADLRGGELHTIMASRTVLHEIDKATADEANAAISGFDNSMSKVALRRKAVEGNQLAVIGADLEQVPSVSEIDWLADTSACRAPE